MSDKTSDIRIKEFIAFIAFILISEYGQSCTSFKGSEKAQKEQYAFRLKAI